MVAYMLIAGFICMALTLVGFLKGEGAILTVLWFAAAAWAAS